MDINIKADSDGDRIFLDVAPITYSSLVICIFVVLSYTANAQALCQDPVGQLTSIEGEVTIQKKDGNRYPGQLNMPLCKGNILSVEDHSRAAVQLINNVVLRIDQNTTVRLMDITNDTEHQSWIELVMGAIQSFNRKPWLLRITTPHLKGDIDGTEFYVRVEQENSLLVVLEGHVVVTNDAGRLKLAAGQAALAKAGKALALRKLVRPRDAVQWALYYPPVLYIRPNKFLSDLEQHKEIRQSIEFYLRGDFREASKSITAVPKTIREPRFFTYRASLRLALGRVEEANLDIERALQLAPGNSNALALQSVIAVTQNDQDKALQVAKQAVKAAPNSATPLIALAYAQQAKFDLKNARASLKKAVQLDPKNALAWARLAELWSSFGRFDQALKAAQQAIVLAPRLSRTQTVLGFAYLTQVKITKAKETFTKAIMLDQADPLPRLGLGLAKIRAGELHEGRREIEVAMGLDPNNSIVRSYLGKAYYEEKRLPLSEREYVTAKELDPQDPTPWFYDAIAKQTTNRPVEALHNLEKSINLNNNRAVYRSRLLLDSDLAARSASLGRIYEDLGFQQLALVEGWKSVNIDPSNFSAHRLLADSYVTLPRHEIARVSELLQSQLLQPLNVTPIQPRLSESNLFLLNAGGPTKLSFNEFNSLFNRDRGTLLISNLMGENGTFGGEGVISNIYKKRPSVWA